MQQRLREAESARSTQSLPPSVEMRKLQKEKDELRDAVTGFETELMQVCPHLQPQAVNYAVFVLTSFVVFFLCT